MIAFLVPIGAVRISNYLFSGDETDAAKIGETECGKREVIENKEVRRLPAGDRWS